MTNPNNPDYTNIDSLNQGASATIPAPTNPGGGALPGGTTFVAGDGRPTWATVNADGTILVAPDSAVPAGTYLIPVKVTYPDGTSAVIDSSVTVVNPNNAAYGTVNVNQGESATLAAPTSDGSPLPGGTTFTSQGGPSWATLNDDGSITVTPGNTVPSGIYTYPVQVTYPDGSTQLITAQIVVANDTVPVYPEGTTVNQGATGNIEVPRNADDSPLPSGTTFATGEGWPTWATLNNDGSISVEPNSSVPAGTYGLPVVVTTPDGATFATTAQVTVVNPNNPVYSGPTSVNQGGSETIVTPTNDPGALPEGTTFAPGNGTPDWATVDSDGSITVNPGVTVTPGEYSVPVVVTTPDGAQFLINALVDVVNPNDPSYDPVDPIAQGSTVTAPAPANSDGSALPEETTFELSPTWTLTGVTVNPDGSVTMSPSPRSVPGPYSIPIIATYPDGTKETIVLNVSTYNPNNPDYTDVTVEQGSKATIVRPVNPDGSTPPGDGTLPDGTSYEGTRYAFGDGVPSWAQSLDPTTGAFEVAPASSVVAGTYTIPVVVSYADGTSQVIDVAVTVTNSNNPSYGDPVTTTQGNTATLPAPVNPAGDDGTVQPLPSGTTFDKVLPWPDGASLSEDGSISFATTSATTPGAYPLPVKVTYPDGTSQIIVGTIVVVNPNNPVYEGPTTLNQGETVTLPAPLTPADSGPGTPVPAGSTLSLNANEHDWVSVNASTGELTIEPGYSVVPGTYTIPVNLTYRDGTSQVLTTTVTVNNLFDPTYTQPTDSVSQGGTLVIGSPSTGAGAPSTWPDGTTFSLVHAGFDTVSINPGTGQITVSPAANLPGGEYTIVVAVTTPDGIVFERPITVTVADTQTPVITPIDDLVVPTDQAATPIKVEVTDAQGQVVVTVVGLPAGMTYDPATGEITGTPTTAGTYPVSITATDAAGNKATETFTITVIDPVYVPVTVNQGGEKVIPLPTNSDGSPLPAGTTISAPDVPSWVTVNEDGTITARPAADTPTGTTTIDVTVTLPNGASTVIQLPITVVDATAPTIGWIDNTVVPVNQPITPIPVVVTDNGAALLTSRLAACRMA